VTRKLHGQQWPAEVASKALMFFNFFGPATTAMSAAKSSKPPLGKFNVWWWRIFNEG